MNCLIIVGPSSTGRRESEVEIRIRTYSDSITSVHRGAERIEDYSDYVTFALTSPMRICFKYCLAFRYVFVEM